MYIYVCNIYLENTALQTKNTLDGYIFNPFFFPE